jgi:hypothetical protein
MIVEHLPESARAKYAAIETEAVDAAALVRAATHRLNQTEARAQQLEQVFDTFPSPERRRQAEQEMSDVQAELARLREQQQERAARERLTGNLLGRLRGFIGSLPPNTDLETVPKSEPPLHEGESIIVAIERVRGELFSAQTELAGLHAAPLPADELKQLASEAVARLTKPSMQVRDGRLDVTWPKDPIAFVAWIDPERVLARLHEQIDRLPIQANAVSTAERSRRTAEIGARVLKLEHEEEALVQSALTAGHAVCRREGVSPAVVLGVRIGQRASAAA